MLKAFRPRTSPPTTASVLRSVLWPLAILSIIHRSYVLVFNRYITDDFAPVYRAVINFKFGWDIYNEHFDYVDPHYLYPPGGTLIMAPFGYLPEVASRNWFIFFNTVAIILAGYFLLRLFGFTLSSVAAPALLLAMFCTESVTNTLVFGNINGVMLLLEVLFFRWLLDGNRSHEWWAGVSIGLTLVVKPLLAPLLLLPLLNRQWRVLVTAIAVPVVFNVAAWPLISDPMNFVTRTVPYIFSTRDYFNSSILGNGLYFGLPTWLILTLRVAFAVLGAAALSAALPLLPHPRPVLLDAHLLRRAAHHLVAGALAGAGLLLDHAVSVPDDRRAAELGDPQLGGVAGGLRVPDDGSLVALAAAEHRARAGVSEDHLRLVADGDRGLHHAAVPLPRRPGGRPSRRGHRSGVAASTRSRVRGAE